MENLPRLPRALAAWGVVAAVELGFQLGLPSTVLNRSLLALPVRVSLVALDLALLLVCLLVTVYAVTAVGARLRTRGARVAGRLVLFVLATVAATLYLSSWMQFYYTAQFLDSAGLGFWWSHPTQLLQHVEHMTPLLFAATPVAALTLALVLTLAVPAAVAGLSSGAQRRLVAAGGVAGLTVVAAMVLGVVAVHVSGGEVSDAGTGLRYSRLERYLLERWERSGPLPHVLLQPRELYNATVSGGARPAVTRRRQVEMASYVATIDPAGVHRYNVIVVLIESLRPDQLQAFGGPRPVLDAVDALAAGSRRFTQTYTQASTSSYADLCPLSSHYPLRGRAFHQYPVDPAYPRVLIYDILHSLGYAVGIFSSQNETWGGMKNFLDTGSVDRFVEADTYDGPTYVPRLDTGFAKWVQGEKLAGKIDDRYTIDEALKWFDGLGEQPFFAYLNLQNSHVPYELPADFPHRYGPETIDFTIAFAQFPREEVEVVKDLYSDSLVYVDHHFARLIKGLEASGRLKDTIVVVSGDTGQAFYEHGYAAHGGPLYDEVMRVPLIIHAPGLASGSDARLAQHVDVPPTILGLLGLPPHPAYQGLDLLATGSGAATERPRSAYLLGQGALATQLAIVRDSKKLIFDNKEQRYRLYDLARDPDERVDLADARQDLVRDLGARLETWALEQLAYYESDERQRTEYPPVLEP